MKKIILGFFLVAGSVSVNAQSLKDINTYVTIRSYAKAKPMVDKFLADPKNANNAEAWYYKGTIYNMLSHDSTQAANAAAYRAEAFNAYKKSQELDASDKFLKGENYIPYLDLYYSYYQNGADQFNAKNYDASYSAFKNALDVHDYIVAKNYTYKDANISRLDTALVLNTGVAAMQAKKNDESITYFNQIINAGVNSASYEDVYNTVITHYRTTGDNAKLVATLAKARAAYPSNPYWNEVELDILKKSGDKKALFAKYEEFTNANPQDFATLYNYAVELFNTIYASDADAKKVAETGATTEKLTSVLNKAIAADKDITGTVLMANHQFNLAYNINDLVTAAKDPKKKADLKAQFMKQVDVTIPYAEKVITYYDGLSTLTGGQKATYNQQINHLVDFYKLKNNTAKANMYNAKLKK